MPRMVEFYQLKEKFVDSRDVPERVQHLIYYNLAIGHHIGVLDCFRKVLEIGGASYARWVGKLPPGEGRRKLEGVLKWGEIEINRDHVSPILDALWEVPDLLPEEREWSRSLSTILDLIRQEPEIYLLVRQV